MCPVYARKLSKGIKYWYSGQYLGVRYHSKAIYLTKKEAKTAEAYRIKQIDEEQRNPVKDIKLIDLCNERLDHIQLKKSKAYYTDTRNYLKKAIDDFGDKYVSEITRKMVSDLILKEAQRLKQSGRTYHKLNAMIRSLKALFNFGIRLYDLNIKNPVNLELYSIDKKVKYIPPIEDIEAVRAVLNDRQRLMIDFCLQTGARINEVLNLKPEDVREDTIILYTRKSRHSDLTPRIIPRPDCLKGKFKGNRIFDEYSTTQPPRFLIKAIKKLKQKVWGWHSLRHYFASHAIKNGMPLTELQYRLGHSSIQTTNIYLQKIGWTSM
jgi:integrase